MKKAVSILSLALLAGVAAYVSAEDQPAKDATGDQTSDTASTEAWAPPNGAINRFCAVQTENKIDPKGKTYVYNGKTIGFCCPDCIDEFKKNPEKYMATLK